jgi:peptidoglycan L-alanyl-D-glutamate endopeptidase CwlK
MAANHNYGAGSNAKLATCHDEIVLVMGQALEMTPAYLDITIVHGFRNKAEQNGIDPRFTTKRWPASYHNAEDADGEPCADACDFAPYIMLPSGKMGIPWKDTHLFSYLAGIVQAAANHLGIDITWGGDFDRDGSTEDQSLGDYGHIQRRNATPRPPAED